ncbi:multicopper oxidase family protein [Brevibacterium sp. W7.2]|uniref:multicopper oxidase family protein n=1 Tax=Brevibacterium sp. W7.2 TaxID=2823518 RepID=UPI0032C24B06
MNHSSENTTERRFDGLPTSPSLTEATPTTPEHVHPARPSRRPGRRSFLVGSLSVLALAACTPRGEGAFLMPDSQRVADVEDDRETTGKTVEVALTAAASALKLGTTTAQTWSYGEIPAPVIRMSRGDRLKATLTNDLTEDTTIHWHGLALRNDMDGVPMLTQDPVAPGQSFTYDFIAPDPGTYWFHPHVGAQIDRGLYGALIVDDPDEQLEYDDEWVIILDDWLDGVTATPAEVLTELRQGMGGSSSSSGDMGGMDHGNMGGSDSGDISGMGGMDHSGMGGPMRMGNMLMGAASDVLGGDAGDVYYPTYLINGRPADDPATFEAKPGAKVRLRIINAGGDTAFRLALTGHSLTVTHTDGFPVDGKAAETQSLLLGMGERYDAVVTLGDGVFALVAEAEGKQERVHAVVRTGSGEAPPTDGNVAELAAAPLSAEALKARSDVALPAKSADRELTLRLTGSMAAYDWAFDETPYDHEKPMDTAQAVAEGERVRLSFVNETDMWHPLHLHGHTFQLTGGGPRKDTAIVLPGKTLTVEFDANNPGRWLTHCHNIYHGEAGMMSVIAYEE